MNVNRIQAVIQIIPKNPLLYQPFKIPIGCRDKAEIYLV